MTFWVSLNTNFTHEILFVITGKIHNKNDLNQVSQNRAFIITQFLISSLTVQSNLYTMTTLGTKKSGRFSILRWLLFRGSKKVSNYNFQIKEKFGFTISNFQIMVKMDKSGRCTQVNIKFQARFVWPLVAVDRWLLFRGCFSTKIAWAGFRVVVRTSLTLCGKCYQNCRRIVVSADCRVG